MNHLLITRKKLFDRDHVCVWRQAGTGRYGIDGIPLADQAEQNTTSSVLRPLLTGNGSQYLAAISTSLEEAEKNVNTKKFDYYVIIFRDTPRQRYEIWARDGGPEQTEDLLIMTGSMMERWMTLFQEDQQFLLIKDCSAQPMENVVATMIKMNKRGEVSRSKYYQHINQG